MKEKTKFYSNIYLSFTKQTNEQGNYFLSLKQIKIKLRKGRFTKKIVRGRCYYLPFLEFPKYKEM